MHGYITGLGVFLPNPPVDNDGVDALLGAVPGQSSTVRNVILGRNGIKQRHYAIDPATGRPTHSNAELTAEAVRDLLRGTGAGLDEVQLLSCGTSSPDHAIPNHALMVQGLLKGGPWEAVATAGVCCSGMTALKYAYLSLMAGTARKAIATGSELASGSLKAAQFQGQAEHADSPRALLAFDREFLRYMLSDGAGAMLLEDAPRPGSLSLRIDWLDILAYAGELETCMYSGGVKQPDGSLRGWREFEMAEVAQRGYMNLSQDVRFLAKHVIPTAGRFLCGLRERRGLKAEEIDWFLPHLSSMFFWKPLCEEMAKSGLAVPEDRWFTNLACKGNIGAASIYVILHELYSSGKLQQGQRILCAVPESARFTFAGLHLTVV
jgi:3-oxoacyl-[acyl-carrier-protein] synthase III